jgi:hypothetical protein
MRKSGHPDAQLAFTAAMTALRICHFRRVATPDGMVLAEMNGREQPVNYWWCLEFVPLLASPSRPQTNHLQTPAEPAQRLGTDHRLH